MTDGPGFVGAKAVLLNGDRVLVYLRDDVPGLPWAGMWDLPGGGREGHESPAECVLREIAEEFGLALPTDRLVYRLELPSMTDPAKMAWLFGGRIDEAEIAAIRFGTEGQRWEMMPVTTFMAHGRAIPQIRRRVGIVWNALAGKARSRRLRPVAAPRRSA